MSKTSSYNESHIITLTEVEHVRKNADMYIGVTDTPNHLLYEVLDNALDEATAGYADLILVSVDNKNHIFTVADNGRGIPFKDGTLVRIATKLFTGGKFKKGENSDSYKISSGLHGIGLLAVTALSDWVEITVYRDKKKVFYRFEDCKVVQSTEEAWDTKSPCSTCVKFKPTKKYFEKLEMDINKIRRRLEVASVYIKDLKLIFCDGVHPGETIKMTPEEFFKINFYGNSDSKNHTKIFEFNEKIKDEQLNIMFGWDTNSYSQPICDGCVNLLPVSQGTHINSTYSLFQEIFESIAKKEKLNYNPTDYKIGFRVYTTLALYETHYSSQTKEKLSNRKSEIEHLYANAKKKIEAMLREDEELYNKIVYFIDSYRKSLTVKKSIVKNTNRETSRYNQSVDSKLRDCTSVNPKECELFITEGDSASGGLVQCRNPKNHAILSIRGKVKNVADPKINYLKNKEIVEMINSLGTGCGHDFDINLLKYDKIIIACDPDVDGDHIAILLICFFCRALEELIRQGKVYIAVMPLYGTTYKGKFIPFYEYNDMLKFKEEHPDAEITRYKGLGEMMPNQLKECLLNKNIRRLIRIKSEENFDGIFKLLSDSDAKRGLIVEGDSDE